MQGIVIIANTLVLIGVIGLRIAVLASALLLPFEVRVTVNEEGIRD
jgi:hypothetical protein